MICKDNLECFRVDLLQCGQWSAYGYTCTCYTAMFGFQLKAPQSDTVYNSLFTDRSEILTFNFIPYMYIMFFVFCGGFFLGGERKAAYNGICLSVLRQSFLLQIEKYELIDMTDWLDDHNGCCWHEMLVMGTCMYNVHSTIHHSYGVLISLWSRIIF